MAPWCLFLGTYPHGMHTHVRTSGRCFFIKQRQSDESVFLLLGDSGPVTSPMAVTGSSLELGDRDSAKVNSTVNGLHQRTRSFIFFRLGKGWGAQL